MALIEQDWRIRSARRTIEGYVLANEALISHSNNELHLDMGREAQPKSTPTDLGQGVRCRDIPVRLAAAGDCFHGSVTAYPCSPCVSTRNRWPHLLVHSANGGIQPFRIRRRYSGSGYRRVCRLDWLVARWLVGTLRTISSGAPSLHLGCGLVKFVTESGKIGQCVPNMLLGRPCFVGELFADSSACLRAVLGGGCQSAIRLSYEIDQYGLRCRGEGCGSGVNMSRHI